MQDQDTHKSMRITSLLKRTKVCDNIISHMWWFTDLTNDNKPIKWYACTQPKTIAKILLLIGSGWLVGWFLPASQFHFENHPHYCKHPYLVGHESFRNLELGMRMFVSPYVQKERKRTYWPPTGIPKLQAWLKSIYSTLKTWKKFCTV